MYSEIIYLLEQLKQGDPEAYDYVYTKNRLWMTVVALQKLKDEAEAQDVVQEFFMDFFDRKLFLHIGPPYDLKRYLFHSICNRCIDKIRRRKARAKYYNRFSEKSTIIDIPESNIEKKERQLEISKIFDTAMKHLPKQSAKAFKLSYIDQKSREEVAKEMGKSPNTVRNLLVYALSILRKQLKNVDHI